MIATHLRHSIGRSFGECGLSARYVTDNVDEVDCARCRKTERLRRLYMYQKRKPIRMKKILDSARGEECTLNFEDICNHNPETTVWAHSNKAEDGKGMGQKADDIYGCYACSDCHDVLDGRRQRTGHNLTDVESYFTRAMKKSWRRLIEKGVLK